MRPALLLLFLLPLMCGCKSFDPTYFWKMNRGDNAMNDDGYFSVPVGEIHPASTDTSAPQTDE